MNALTFTEQEAVGFFFKDYPENWDVEQILDALADRDDRVRLWNVFQPLNAAEITEAVNDLLHLIRRIKKQGGIL